VIRRGLPLAALLLAALPATALTVVDDEGARVTPKPGPCRIVSLAPGTTAMLYAAGAGPCVVGTIKHSEEPAEALQLPVIGDAESLDLERLLALRPTVVVVAVDVVQRVRIERLMKLGIPVYQVHVTSLTGMPDSLEKLGTLTGTADTAKRVAKELRAELARLRESYGGRRKLKVMYQIWDRPIYTIGGKHVITDALGICGASNIYADLAGVAAPAVTREASILRDPEVILISAPPGQGNEWLEAWRQFPALTAVKYGQLIKYNDLRLDRMGPSVVAATADLCDVLDGARGAIGLANLPPTN
jgi:iron complex transport system substrate-binding protein